MSNTIIPFPGVTTKEVKATSIFPKLAKPGKESIFDTVTVPMGEFDTTDEGQRVKNLVPKLDPYYKFPVKQVKPFLIALSLRDNVYIHGSTGTGKTMFVKMICATLKLPLTRINCDPHMTRVDLVGYRGLPDPNDPTDDGYKTTALVRGIQRPGVILLDEVDRLMAETGIVLQALLEDDNPGLYLVEQDLFIPKHPDCFIIATANTRGMGDEVGIYTSAQVLDYAWMNRFHMVFELEPMPKDNMNELLEAIQKKCCIKDDVREAMVRFYDAVLKAWKAGDLTTPLSVRSIVHLAEHYAKLGPFAIKYTILDKIPSITNRQSVLLLAQAQKLAPQTDD